jgi:plasmid stabilization system protein ParE
MTTTEDVTYAVRLRPEAIADVDRALAYYAAIRIELFLELEAEFDEHFEQLAERPLSFQAHNEATRRVFMRKFPYGIYYLIDKAEVIVLAVFHFADDPEKLEDRLENAG